MRKSERKESRIARKRQVAIIDGRDAEFYSQGVAAWFASALEHDKSLLTLSVAGIGFLISLAQTASMKTAIASPCMLALYVGSVVAFLACLIAVLSIFRRNKTHIQDILSGGDRDDRLLAVLDKFASLSFFAAMLVSALLGISVAFVNYHEGVKEMTDKAKPKTKQPGVAQDSVNGLAKLRPITESFNHMKNLQNSSQAATKPQTQNQAGNHVGQTATKSAQPNPQQNNASKK